MDMQLIEIRIQGMDFKLIMKSSMLDEGRGSFDVHGWRSRKHSSSILNYGECQEEQEGREDSEEELDVVTMPKHAKHGGKI